MSYFVTIVPNPFIIHCAINFVGGYHGDSQHTWGIWVDFPQPVSPTMTTVW